jgi:hypothetical protein
VNLRTSEGKKSEGASRHRFGPRKERQARQWLEFRDWSKSSKDSRQSLGLTRKANEIARSRNTIDTVALIIAVTVIAVSIAGVSAKR